MNNKDQTPGKDPEEIILARIQRDDGSEEVITGKDFIKTIELVTELAGKKDKLEKSEEIRQMASNEKEGLEIFAELLRRVLDELPIEQLKGHGETLQDVLIAADYLIEFFGRLGTLEEELPQIGEQTRAFLEGRRDLMTVARPLGIEDFLKIKDNGAEVTRQFENSTITFTGRLGMNEHKVAEVIRMRFTELNPYRAKTNLKTLIDVPLTALMEGTGRTVTPNNKKAFVRKLTREILPTIAHAHITLKTETADGMELKHMEVGGGYFEVSTKNDRILFRISPEYAAYLNTNSLSHYHRKTLLLGDSKSGDELPYYLCIKLQDHYFKDKNKSRGVNMILSIKSVLKFCEDNILCDYIMETDPTHWKRKIKARLEKALDEIQERGIFEWKYCGPGQKEITQAEIDAADFYRWSEKLYITFQFIPEEPDESERLQNKRERIEAAKERKALEDDKITVEAAKIRKRRRRKSAEKEKKG